MARSVHFVGRLIQQPLTYTWHSGLTINNDQELRMMVNVVLGNCPDVHWTTYHHYHQLILGSDIRQLDTIELLNLIILKLPYLRSIAWTVGCPLTSDFLHNTPWLDRITTLYSSFPQEGRVFFDMLSSPHLTNLDHLNLYRQHLGDEFVQALVKSPLVKQLRFCSLIEQDITDVGATMLANCPHFDKMKGISLKENQLSAAGLLTLFQSEYFTKFDTVFLEGNPGCDRFLSHIEEVFPLSSNLRSQWMAG